MTVLEDLLAEALDYQRGAFEEDEELDGGDLVEWFAEWRIRVNKEMEGKA